MQCPNLGRKTERKNLPKSCHLSQTAINILFYSSCLLQFLYYSKNNVISIKN